MFSTDICKATVDPKWNSHYDLFLFRGDGVTISVWNQKKMHKNSSSGFLGCVRITASTVQRLKDTGCESYDIFRPKSDNLLLSIVDQRMDLCKSSPDDQTPVKGQIIISMLSRDAITGTGNPGLAIVGPAGDVRGPDEDEPANEPRIPEGWEDRRTPDGRVYYVNHVTRTTQWSRPTQPASASQTTVTNGQNLTESNTQTPPGPSRSSTMNNIEQSPSNGSLNIETAPESRRHSTENIIGTTNGEISNSSSTNSIENKLATASPTTATAISSPRNSILLQNVQINALTANLGSLAIDTNMNSTDATEAHPPLMSTTTPVTANSNIARTVIKTTNLSPTQQQQVPPNTTAPMNGAPPSDRSPPTTNLQRSEDTSAPGTPQRPAEVIQNRNAADGELK